MIRKTILVLLLLFTIVQNVEARDPKSDEMGPIQEIAGYLLSDAIEAYREVIAEAARDSQYDKLLDPMLRMQVKAQLFYEKVVKNSRSPWRSSSAYNELNNAFINARQAFVERGLYVSNPQPFEELAFLMGALLQYYQEPIYQYTVPGPVYAGRNTAYPAYAAYPRVVYPWIPNYYTFSSCRFLNTNLYPWGRGVVIRGGR